MIFKKKHKDLSLEDKYKLEIKKSRRKKPLYTLINLAILICLIGGFKAYTIHPNDFKYNYKYDYQTEVAFSIEYVIKYFDVNNDESKNFVKNHSLSSVGLFYKSQEVRVSNVSAKSVEVKNNEITVVISLFLNDFNYQTSVVLNDDDNFIVTKPLLFTPFSYEVATEESFKNDMSLDTSYTVLTELEKSNISSFLITFYDTYNKSYQDALLFYSEVVPLSANTYYDTTNITISDAKFDSNITYVIVSVDYVINDVNFNELGRTKIKQKIMLNFDTKKIISIDLN